MRKEDHRLLRGQGCFVDDLFLPGALHAAFLRSPYAHARIGNIDTSTLADMRGVVRAVTAADLAFPHRLPVIRTHPGLRHPAGPEVLASDMVRYQGEPVAMVLADTRYVAEDALEQIVVDYEPMPVVGDAIEALSPGSPRVHERMPTNVAGSYTQSTGNVEAALQEADQVITFQCSISRGSAQPIETRGVAAIPDSEGLTVWINTQRPKVIRDLLVDYLGRSAEKVRVVVPDTGGAFGSKAYLYSEDLLACWAAHELGRPVRWMEDRSEHFLATFPEHRQLFEVQVGCHRDGRLSALRVDLIHDLGAYSPYGFAVPQNTADHVVGPYLIPNVEFSWRGVYTNRTPSAPYRGAGRPQGVFVLERALDAVARHLRHDPADVRRVNLIPSAAMPYDTGLDTPAGPLVYDSGDYARCFERALSAADYYGWRARQSTLRADGRLVGVGVANYVECSLTPPHESASVRLSPDGKIEVGVGVSAQGQGHETVFAGVAGSVLGLAPADIRVTGASEDISETVGTYGSRSAIMAGSAVAGAAERLREKALDLVGEKLRVTQTAFTVAADGIRRTDGSPAGLSWRQVAALAKERGVSLEARYVFRSSAWHVANGTHVVALEVEPFTGRVNILRYVVAHDAGRMLDRGIVEGQILGGIAQGIAGSLLEELSYDENGQLLSGSFMDYLLPTSAEIPDVEIHHFETPSPNNPLGVKGVGEGGIIPTYAAIISALEDSIGTTLSCSPLSPARIRATIKEAGVETLSLEPRAS